MWGKKLFKLERGISMETLVSEEAEFVMDSVVDG